MEDLLAHSWDGRAPGDPSRWRQLRTDQFLRTIAASRPDKEAIRFEGRSITFAELDALANRAANGLLALGARPRDVVAVMAENQLEVFSLMYGISRGGFTVLPLNTRSTAEEIRYQIAEAGAKMVIAPGHTDMADVFARGSEAPPDIEWSESDFYHVRFTSGTTGKPKAIAVTQRAIAYMHMAHAREMRYSALDVSLTTAPIAHAGFHVAAAVLSVGGTIVLERGFDARRVWEICDEHQVTHAYMVPTMFALSLESPGSGDSIKALLVMASAFPLALKDRVRERFPHAEIYENYGANEVGMVTLLRPTDPREKDGSVGRAAFGYEMRVLDEDGRDLPPGQVGEIYTRGPALSYGYVGSASMKPNQAREGWVSAGDLGWLDEDGFLFIADRRDDLIVSGGLNVYPAEIEAVLTGAAGVREVAVIGVPHEIWGHKVVAIICGSATPETLDAHCRAVLAGYKVPKQYHFVEELPRNYVGKVLRYVLREQFA